MAETVSGGVARIVSVRDSKWVRTTFALTSNSDSFNDIRKKYRYAHSGLNKFTNTRLGGNFSINPPPQFTSIADPPVSIQLKMKKNDLPRSDMAGMGHYYNEAIDDNGQHVIMRFGVPEYNGMLTFFTGFFDAQANLMASEGRVDSGFAFTLGQAVGLYGLYKLWPLVIVIGAGRAYKYLTRTPTSKYYYLREAMGLYWNRVNTIANAIGTNLQVIQRAHMPLLDGQESSTERNFDKEYLDKMRALAPDIFNETGGMFSRGGVDVFAIATKVQRKAIRWRQAMDEEIANGVDVGQANFDSVFGDTQATTLQNKYNEIAMQAEADIPLTTILEWYKKSEMGKMSSREGLTSEEFQEVYDNAVVAAAGSNEAATIGNDQTTQANKDIKVKNISKLKLRPGKIGTGEPIFVTDKQGNNTGSQIKYTTDGAGYVRETDPNAEVSESVYDQILGFFDPDGSIRSAGRAEIQDGSQFIQFRVDPTGSVQESFSNATAQSSLQTKMNGISADARSARFSFSEGNTGFAPLDAVFGAFTSFASGALDTIQMSGMMALAGSAFTDIPEVYQSSSTTFPSLSFTVKLRSPYGNRLAQFQNLYIPLSMLLAGALPMSTGQQSYTSPFLVEMYCKGRQSIRLGIIDSMSVSRGVGNLGWNQNHEALGIDVTFSVKDLSTIMHAPIDDMGGVLPPWSGIMADDSAFSDYMGVLGSLSLADQIYPTRKLSLAVTRKLAELGKYGRSSYWVNYAANTEVGRMFAAFGRDPDISVNF